MNLNDIRTEEKVRLDPKCWTGKKIGNPKTKMKGGVRVNNCVPAESVAEGQEVDVSVVVGKLYDIIDHAENEIKNADYDRQVQYLTIVRDRALEALNMIKLNPRAANSAWKYFQNGKQGVAEDFNAEYDDEAGMAHGSLHTLKNAVEGLSQVIEDGDNLPEWCQEKISIAEDYLVTVWDYLQSEKAQGIDPEIEEMYEAIDSMAEALARKYNISLDEAWESFEALPDHVLYETAQYRLSVLNEDWQKVNKQDRTDGMSRKAVKAYRRENPGSKLKTAVTTKPSKLKKGGKAAKRRKSFCARMRGMKKSRASAKTKRNPNSPINKALRRWNC